MQIKQFIKSLRSLVVAKNLDYERVNKIIWIQNYSLIHASHNVYACRGGILKLLLQN